MRVPSYRNQYPQATYDAFMRTKPSLEAFEAELRKYNTLEQEIAAIPTLHNIGARAYLRVCVCAWGVCGGGRVGVGAVRQRESHQLRAWGC